MIRTFWIIWKLVFWLSKFQNKSQKYKHEHSSWEWVVGWKAESRQELFNFIQVKMKLWKETNIRFIFFPDGFFSQECNDTEFSQWWRDFWELVDIHEVLKGNYLKYFKSFKISLRVVYKINKKNHFNIRVKVWTHLTWYHGYYYVILSHVTPSDPKTLTKHMLSFNSELFCILIGKKKNTFTR